MSFPSFLSYYEDFKQVLRSRESKSFWMCPVLGCNNSFSCKCASSKYSSRSTVLPSIREAL
ncbi:hypothetical protein OZD61_03260 [Wolbachia endosymbiont of Drosophila bocki]|nr:hypothetical protein [Wolbachia endosymbiont of Drosophila bocki]